MIRDFLETVWGDETEGRASVWWRRKPGQKQPIDAQKWFDWPRQADEIVQFIESKSALDVYVPVALFNEDKRVPEAATTTGTVWQDTDTFDPAGYRIQPSVIVETSPGRYHCWWQLDKAYPAEQTELVTRKITYAHKDAGADVSSWGRNKLLRVPGTYNSSHGFPERVKATFTGNIYELRELAEAYDDIPIPTGPAAKMRTPMPGLPDRERPDNLPEFIEVQSKLPDDFPIDLITREPGAENRSEMRWKLIAELVEAGLSDEETFVIAWKAKCASKWWEDPRGEDGLWAEITKERQRYEWGAKPDAKPVTKPRSAKKRQPIEILTAEERAHAKRVFQKTWIHEYEEWVRGRVKIFNAPYHRAGAWMALSQLTGETARLNIDGNDVPLGLYFFVLGGTTTGKSQAKGYMRRVIHNGYHGEKNPDIGDDVSIAALLDVLRDRENGTGLMSSDEVDGMLNKMKDRHGWRSEDMSKYTDLYDGSVPPLVRKGNIDGKWTKVQFSWFGMGTEVKVVDALDRVMFESGFLARFQWFIGEDINVSEDDLGVSFGGESSYRQQLDVIAGWADHFRGVHEAWSFRRMQAPGNLPIIQPDNTETAEYFRKATAKIEKRLFAGDPNLDILRPSLSRTVITAAKFAALLALADNRFTFTKDDLLVALWHCEELLGNLHYIAGQVSSSEHAKQLDAVYDFIVQHGPDCKSERIFRAMSDKFGLDVSTVERYRDELRAQNRISFVQNGQKHGWVATAVEED